MVFKKLTFTRPLTHSLTHYLYTMLQPALVTLYLLLGLWLLRRTGRSMGVPVWWQQGAFIYKILLGFANYFIWMHIIGHGDSLRYVHDSLVVYNSLFDQPGYFLELVTRTSLENVPPHLIPYQKSLFIEWHVPEYNMVRLLAILNVFTAGNAWGNIVLISAAVMAAQLWLYRILTQQFSLPDCRQKLLFAVSFLLPSTIFWSSGLLKEGPVLALLSLIVGSGLRFYHAAGTDRWKYLLLMFAATTVLYAIRDYVAILLVVNGLGIWLVSLHPAPRKVPLLSHSLYIMVCTGILIGMAQAPSAPDLFKHLRNEQTYFTVSAPDPDYSFQTLDGTPGDVFRKVPYTINNILFRPNILHSNSAFRIYQSAELLLIWIAIALLLVRNRSSIRWSPPSAALLFLFLELLFLFGLMVTDADTLSRYRSIPIMGLLCLIFILPSQKSA